MPDYEAQRAAGAISGDAYVSCRKLADESASDEDRLRACRDLLRDEGLPFLTERWASMAHVHLAAACNQPEEYLEAVRHWLDKYPNPRAQAPEDWKQRHPGEADTNMVLRVETGRIVAQVLAGPFSWSGDERMALLKEFMSPLLDKNLFAPLEGETLNGQLLYAEWLGTLGDAWALLNQNLYAQEGPEGLSKLEQQRWPAKLRALEERERVYTHVLGVLDEIAATPAATPLIEARELEGFRKKAVTGLEETRTGIADAKRRAETPAPPPKPAPSSRMRKKDRDR